jgi:hypothetical protein
MQPELPLLIGIEIASVFSYVNSTAIYLLIKNRDVLMYWSYLIWVHESLVEFSNLVS